MLFFKRSEWNILLLAFLTIISIFTQEIVTFVMLAFILLTLNKIYFVLKDIAKKMGGDDGTDTNLG